MTTESAERARRTVYGLLIVVTVALACARILAIERVYEPSIYRPNSRADLAAVVLPLSAAGPADQLTILPIAAQAWSRIDVLAPPRLWPPRRPAVSPTFSSNDKSRWATVRALVDHGTFVIGRRDRSPDGRFRDSGIIFEDGWESIDKVLHPETGAFYSSKPPLLPVLVAGEYWLLKHGLGWQIAEHPQRVIATILLTINALPLAVYLTVLAVLIERYGRSDFGRLFTFAAACFGTFVTTFANTFNNHTPAAITALLAAAPLLCGWRSVWAAVVAGLLAGLTASFELPALALTALLTVVMLRREGWARAVVFAAAAAVPVAAQVALNAAVLGDWKPAYEKTDTVWYRYEGSHWNKQGSERRGIDYAADQESRGVYAFHLLLGHHGLFSLTPIWLLSIVGWSAMALGRDQRGPIWRDVNLAGAAAWLIVILFFAVVVGTRNYGGWTCGPRWFFWLTPFGLLALLPIADRLAKSRGGRGLAYVLLALSVLSAHYSLANPWRHPWLYRAMEACGWRGY